MTLPARMLTQQMKKKLLKSFVTHAVFCGMVSEDLDREKPPMRKVVLVAFFQLLQISLIGSYHSSNVRCILIFVSRRRGLIDESPIRGLELAHFGAFSREWLDYIVVRA